MPPRQQKFEFSSHKPVSQKHVNADRGPILADIADWWMQLRERNTNYAPTTNDTSRENIKNHILPVLGKTHIYDLTPQMLCKWIRALEQKLAAATVRSVASTLRKLLKDSETAERVGPDFVNPMIHECVKQTLSAKLVHPENRKFIVHLGIPQAEKLISCSAVPEMRRVLYLVGFTSGARAIELETLTWSDVIVDDTQPFATFSKSARTKRSSIRTIPLHTEAAKALHAWKAKGWIEYVGRHPSPADLIFPNANSSGHAARVLRADLDIAGCPVQHAGLSVDVLVCRRSFASWLYANDIPEATVKRLLGHAPVDTTQLPNMAAMRRAINSIKLNLSTGQVVSLPMNRAANTASETSSVQERPDTNEDLSRVLEEVRSHLLGILGDDEE